MNSSESQMNGDAFVATMTPVADLGIEARAGFIMRTYLHLTSAIIGFVAIEYALFATGLAWPIAQAMLSVNWLIPLGAFMVAGWLASRFAHRAESLGVQYAALAGFVVAEAVIFVPLLVIAEYQAPGAITNAAALTLLGFMVLTGIAFYTRKDFSFLRTLLMWGGFIAIALIVAGSLFGFDLGLYFAVGMVAFAGAAILYDTSNVLHHYSEDRYVAAALELFSSIALMFWYILSLFSRD